MDLAGRGSVEPQRELLIAPVARDGRRSMSYFSILFTDPKERERAEGAELPDHFRDLALDQVEAAVTAGREAYDLAPFFRTALRDVDAVAYRQEVVRDLERAEVAEAVSAFALAMAETRQRLGLARELRHRYQKQASHLDAALSYTEAVSSLTGALAAAAVASRGLRGLRALLDAYLASPAFRQLAEDARNVRRGLAGVRYSLLIGDDRVTVGRYRGERDHAAAVLRTFERFRRGEAEDHRVAYGDRAEMDRVEEQIVDRVALLFPGEFAALEAFCSRHHDFVDPGVAAFDREVQLYLGYLAHVGRLRRSGLRFSLPCVSDRTKEELVSGTFDLALAHSLGSRGEAIVTNDLELRDGERVLVVTGPNQGGKTTFARTVGQLHHLAALGLPVPGEDARLFLADRILTHFERTERLADLRGKLEDDLTRSRAVLDGATSRSLVILNEIFTSTTLEDALYLSERLMERIVALDGLCVWVTFVEEVATMADSAVSVTSTVRPDDPAVRTFRIVRQPPQGCAYSEAIAAKHGLDHGGLERRLRT